MTLPLHTATRVLRAERRGSSLPVVAATDGGEFFVKLRGAASGVAALAAEIVVAELAEAIGLSVPRRVLIAFPPGLETNDRNDELADVLNASTGINLGFAIVAGARNLRGDEADLVDRETAARTVWLDGLTMNPDRTAKNPNLLIAANKIWLIDHGAALGFLHNFGGVSEDSPRRPPDVRRPHLLAERAGDLSRIDAELAAAVTRECLHSAAAQVPDAFLATREPARQREAIVAFLWKRLKAPRPFAAVPNPAS